MNFDYKKTKEWLLEHDACDACLGRQFHGMFIGDNALIGASVRTSENKEQAQKKLSEKPKPKLSKNCPFCQGLFFRTDETAEKAFELIQNFEFDSFVVGVRIPQELTVKEEKMWTQIGAAYCEPLKKDLKRKIGIHIEQKTNKKAEFQNPDLTLLIDFTKEPPKINLELTPLFVYGEYQKLVRGISQTKWHCPECRGKGCEKCGFTGKAHEESVEEIIAPPLLEEAGGTDEKFHGAGREDVDAKMLGWRPFTVEIMKPVKRNLDFKAIEEKISKTKKVNVKKLRKSSKQEMRLLKKIKLDKTYLLEIHCENKINEKQLEEIQNEFQNTIVSQRTPLRVAERRADKVRKRRIKYVKCEKKTDTMFTAEVKTESGAYVKELVSGDKGRTKPSFAEFVGPCEVKELDVIQVHKRDDMTCL